MPSYCCAVNCKNNGINSDLSFFKFPTHRSDLNQKWMEAAKRINWQPTGHSRLCSVHFEEKCFSHKKGLVRSRLLPDAVPTIFDFRKIKSNRKRAVEYLNMNESQCPDPNLFELKTEPVVVKSAKSGQKCVICHGIANCDVTMETVVTTAKGKVSLTEIVSCMGATLKQVKSNATPSAGFVCMACSQRLVDMYVLQCEIKDNDHFSMDNAPTSFLDDEKLPNIVDSNLGNRSLHPAGDENIVYCSSCDTNFMINDMASHLLYCKMKDEADLSGIPVGTRRLFVCCLCNFLVYRHNAISHMETCCPKIY